MEDFVIDKALVDYFYNISNELILSDYSNIDVIKDIFHNEKYSLNCFRATYINKESRIESCLDILDIFLNIQNIKDDFKLKEIISRLKNDISILKSKNKEYKLDNKYKDLYIEIAFLALNDAFLKLNETEQVNTLLYKGYIKKYFYCFYYYLSLASKGLLKNSESIILSFISRLNFYLDNDFLIKISKNKNYQKYFINLIDEISTFLSDYGFNKEEDELFNKLKTIFTNFNKNNHQFKMIFSIEESNEKENQITYSFEKNDNLYKYFPKRIVDSKMSTNIKSYLNLSLDLNDLIINKKILESRDFSFALNPVFKAIETLLSELISDKFYDFLYKLYLNKGLLNDKNREALRIFFKDKDYKIFFEKNPKGINCMIGEFLKLFGYYERNQNRYVLNNFIYDFIDKNKVSFDENDVDDLLNMIYELKMIRNRVSHRYMVGFNDYKKNFRILFKDTPKLITFIYDKFYDNFVN